MDIRNVLQADIFSDFLDMAEHLLQEKYKDASAVLIGGVLEDGLRKIAHSKGIDTLAKNGKYLSIEPLNVALAQAGIYDTLVQKQVTTWADLRNKAAHGLYDEYDAGQVTHMLQFVQGFLSKHLAHS